MASFTVYEPKNALRSEDNASPKRAADTGRGPGGGAIVYGSGGDVLRSSSSYMDIPLTANRAILSEDANVSRQNDVLQSVPNQARGDLEQGDPLASSRQSQSQGGGLQVLNRKEEWIDAVAAPDELMINIGDMLSRLTNNHLPSTIHRVVNPPKKEWGNTRYSLPFFLHPIPQMPLDCLPQMINDVYPKKYEDITAGAFLRQRLVALGLL